MRAALPDQARHAPDEVVHERNGNHGARGRRSERQPRKALGKRRDCVGGHQPRGQEDVRQRKELRRGRKQGQVSG